MLFRDLVLISRIPRKTRKSLRATSHVHETSRFIKHRHSGCTDFGDCAELTCWATAGDHLNNSNVSLLDNWHRSNWVGESHVDLAAGSSYSSRSSATSHQASQPLHETPGVPHRNHFFDVKEHGDRLGHRPRCSSGDPTVAPAPSFRTWHPGWPLAMASGEVFVSSNHQGRGETPETDWLNRNAKSRRLERCRSR